jgi:HD-GYP domain-containing protein (c-di-GMP phosphodiesterase class II)
VTPGYGVPLRAIPAVALLMGTTAVSIAVAGRLGLLACVPLLALLPAIVRVRAVRATRRQTVACLSRVAELGGQASSGHAIRVSELAGRLARQLDLTDTQIVELERAALLHDVGQLALSAPVHGGHTALLDAEQARHIAQVGAGMIRATGGMDRVADLVEAQAEPFRGAAIVAEQSLGARILKVANAYDDLVGAVPSPGSPTAALWRLRRAGEAEYDPQVLDALARLVGATPAQRSGR